MPGPDGKLTREEYDAMFPEQMRMLENLMKDIPMSEPGEIMDREIRRLREEMDRRASKDPDHAG
jgi:hypothetical protein